MTELISISEEIQAAAKNFPTTRVVAHSDVRPDETTLSDLWDDAARVATNLRELGIEPGDVVAFQLPNWRECLIIHSAAWLTGAVLLPIVPIYGPREVAFVLKQSGAKFFVAPREWRKRDAAPLFDAIADLPELQHRYIVGEALPGTKSFSDLVTGDPSGFVPHLPTDANERTLLVYTSGTTAEPKGVQHTHATLLGEVRAMAEQRGSGPEVTSLSAFPSGHIAGVLGVLRLLTRGTLTVMMDTWNPTAAARLIVKYQVRASGGAPIYLAGLLDVADEEGLDLSCLEEYTTGAANVSPELIRRADRHGIPAFRCYGSTEHPTISSGVPEDPIEKRATTDGRATPGTEIKLVDDDGNEVPVGSDGEILCRGPEQFIGYSNIALNDASFADGWFRTGDVGRLDEDGYLRITDRKKDIIVRGGENISSKEVEDVLLAHPAVSQAAAVGAPDEKYGERVCAFVVLRQGHELTLSDVQDHFVSEGLARQKTPERLEVVEELPRTASGKVQKPALRSLLS